MHPGCFLEHTRLWSRARGEYVCQQYTNKQGQTVPTHAINHCPVAHPLPLPVRHVVTHTYARKHTNHTLAAIYDLCVCVVCAFTHNNSPLLPTLAPKGLTHCLLASPALEVSRVVARGRVLRAARPPLRSPLRCCTGTNKILACAPPPPFFNDQGHK